MLSKFFPFRISKEGLRIHTTWLKDTPDTLFFTWTNLFRGLGFHSNIYNMMFPSYSYYTNFIKYSQVGAHPEKLQSFSFDDVFLDWAKVKFPQGNIIVLHNINTQAKNIEFWAKVPVVTRGHFVNDIAVLVCKDKAETINLVHNLPTEFADAYAFTADSLGVWELHKNTDIEVFE